MGSIPGQGKILHATQPNKYIDKYIACERSLEEGIMMFSSVAMGK